MDSHKAESAPYNKMPKYDVSNRKSIIFDVPALKDSEYRNRKLQLAQKLDYNIYLDNMSPLPTKGKDTFRHNFPDEDYRMVDVREIYNVPPDYWPIDTQENIILVFMDGHRLIANREDIWFNNKLWDIFFGTLPNGYSIPIHREHWIYPALLNNTTINSLLENYRNTINRTYSIEEALKIFHEVDGVGVMSKLYNRLHGSIGRYDNDEMQAGSGQSPHSHSTKSEMQMGIYEHFVRMNLDTIPDFALRDHHSAVKAQRFVFGDAANYTFNLEGYSTSMELPYPECSFEFEDRKKKAILYVKQHRIKNGMHNDGVPVIMCKLFYKESDETPWEFHDFLYRIQMSGGINLTRMMVDMDKPRQADITPAERRRWVGLFDRYSTALLALLHGLANKKVVVVRPSGNLHVAGEEKTEDGTSVVWMSGIIKRTTEHLGGTHASPREHDRIAHYRTYANGKTIRIAAQVVNKGVKGKISKTYRIKKDMLK